MALQLLVIYRMRQGFDRRYPGVFFYLLVLFLTSVADSAAAIDPQAWGGWYRPYFGLNNTARHLAGLAAVVWLYFHATARLPTRWKLRSRVLLVVAVVVGASLYVHYPGRMSWSYMAIVGRDMSFLTALLNLVLWFALIQTRKRERVLFLVSGGLGLNMAGEAIAQSLFDLNPALRPLGSAIAVGTHILCLLIWLRALKVYSLEQRAAARAEAH